MATNSSAATSNASSSWKTGLKPRARKPPRGRRRGNDMRLAIRSLVRAPRFSITALLMLTLSIAAATLTFSVVNGVLLRELPYPDADRLYYLHWKTQSGTLHALSADKSGFWQRYSRTIESFAASDLAT